MGNRRTSGRGEGLLRIDECYLYSNVVGSAWRWDPHLRMWWRYCRFSGASVLRWILALHAEAVGTSMSANGNLRPG